ncbi:Hypothetical protein D9617_19g101640 [Elsinoe fawcettii]|nr:Hypothetical protein D9617_19g101640 [Elsinoe fawcettii]
MAPEVITAYAFGELLAAKLLLKQFKDTGIAHDHWTVAHAFYFSMGSMHLVSRDGYEIPICLRTKSKDGWEMATCNPSVLELLKMEKIQIPQVQQRDIQDRNKADPFTKIFTLFQS